MKWHLLSLIVLGYVLACTPESKSVLKDANPTGLCEGDASSCLVHTQTSEGVTVGQYWVQGPHVYTLIGCENHRAAMDLTGESNSILRAPSQIEVSDAARNPFISCSKTGETPVLDSRFDPSEPVYRVQRQEYYLIRFDADGTDLYFKLDINSCSKVLQSWHVSSERMIEVLDEDPSASIRELKCKRTTPPPPVEKPVDRNRLGWHIYSVDNVFDLSSSEFGEPARIYWLEYVWSDLSRSPLMIGQIKTGGQALPINVAVESLGESVVENLLSELFSTPVEQRFDFGEGVQNEIFLQLAPDFRHTPVAALNLDARTVSHLSVEGLESGLVVSGTTTTSVLPELIKVKSIAPASGDKPVWQSLQFAEGTAARAIQLKVTDDSPLVIEPDSPPAPPETTRIQFLFEQCEDQAGLEGIMGPQLATPSEPGKVPLISHRHQVRKLYRAVKGNQKPDIVRKYPCLKRPSCELDVTAGAQLQALAKDGRGTEVCRANTEHLSIRLKNDIQINESSEHVATLEFRHEGLKQNLPNLKKLSIIADVPVSLIHSCPSCGMSSGTGCQQNGQTAVPVMDFAGFESVRMKNVNIRIKSPDAKPFPFPMAGLKARGGVLILDHVNIGHATTNPALGAYQKFHTGLCSTLAQVYLNQTSLEAIETGAHLNRSQAFWNGSSFGRNNPNFPVFHDQFEEFLGKAEQLESNASQVRAESATGSAIIAADSQIFGVNTSLQTAHYGVLLERNSSVNGYGLDIYGPMTKRPDMTFDPNLAGGASRALMFLGLGQEANQLDFGRIVGFKTAVFLPRAVKKEAGVNRVFIYDSLQNPRQQNAILSNYHPTFSNGELTCSGNCQE